MIEWLKLTDERKRQLLNQANEATGLPVHAIEKDWWVTLTLRALFSTKWKDNLVFKGGTSLSKAWRLIERFSEDIDLAIDREVLGFPKEFVSKTQVEKLRKRTSEFIATDFKEELQKSLLVLGLNQDQFELRVQETDLEDRDPQVLELIYRSALEPDPYIAGKVIIEIGGRSLCEPASDREIKTILHEVFPTQAFSGNAFLVPVVEPMRTFLEKAFLLHEEFSKQPEKMRYDRLSRHLYDLEKLMDSEHATAALNDYDFYTALVEHRKNFNTIRGLDYTRHAPSQINFIPPNDVMGKWEADYVAMRQSMIYGNTREFAVLIQRLYELQSRFRLVSLPQEVLDATSQLRIDRLALIEMINEANDYRLPKNAYLESLDVSVSVTRLTDVYKPASEEKKTRTFSLKIKGEKRNLVFVSIHE